MTYNRVILCVLSLCLLLVAGCGDDPVDVARNEVVAQVVDEDQLSEDNKYRGMTNALNNAKWYDKFFTGLATAVHNNTAPLVNFLTARSEEDKIEQLSAAEMYAKSHPTEVLNAQLNDYVTYDMSQEESSAIDKQQNKVIIRNWLRNNFTWIIIGVVVFIVLFIVIYILTKMDKRQSAREVKAVPVTVPVQTATPPVAALPAKDVPNPTERFAVNYEKGLREYCVSNGKDYSTVLAKHGGDAKKAFNSVYGFED